MEWLYRLLAGLIVALLMLVVSPYLGPWVQMRIGPKKPRTLKFEEVFKLSADLAEQVTNGKGNREPFNPELILGIDGGGCVIAAFMALALKKPVIAFEGDRTGEPLEPKFPKDQVFLTNLKPIIQGKNILLVEDLSNTGGTLRGAQDLLLAEGATTVKTATVCTPHFSRWLERKLTPFKYDYYIEECQHEWNGHIQLPWRGTWSS